MQPWETLADWGAMTQGLPPQDRPGASERPWEPTGWIAAETQARRMARHRCGPPLWAVLAIVVGALLIVCCGLAACIVSAAPDAGSPAVASPSPSLAAVAVNGTCHTRVIGSYGLVASVTIHNASSVVQNGSVWVNWPINGEASRMYSEAMQLGAGEVREFHVNEPIDADRWLRLGMCDYGWSGLQISSGAGTD